MDLSRIQGAIEGRKVKVTDHAEVEAGAGADHLVLGEILTSVANGEIIESYPNDRPYPSCLIHGHGPAGDPIHSVWGYNEMTGWAVLITVYRPDPNRWINWRQ